MKITVLYSPTCVPCKILDQRLKELLRDHPEVEYDHVNAIDHPEYNVKGTPHVIIEKDGKELFAGHTNNVINIINMIKENL